MALFLVSQFILFLSALWRCPLGLGGMCDINVPCRTVTIVKLCFFKFCKYYFPVENTCSYLWVSVTDFCQMLQISSLEFMSQYKIYLNIECVCGGGVKHRDSQFTIFAVPTCFFETLRKEIVFLFLCFTTFHQNSEYVCSCFPWVLLSGGQYMSHMFCVADFDKKQKMFYFGLSKDPRTI